MYDTEIDLGTVDRAAARKREDRRVALVAVVSVLFGIVTAVVVLGLLPGWLGY